LWLRPTPSKTIPRSFKMDLSFDDGDDVPLTACPGDFFNSLLEFSRYHGAWMPRRLTAS
jgi:hypothetical protein